MIFNRLSTLMGAFGSFRAHPGAHDPEVERHRARAATDTAIAMGHRWTRAFSRDPALREDVIRLGGVFVLPPVENHGGFPEPAPQDPYVCGREAGRRELALQILALGGMTHDDFNQLMEDDNNADL